MIALGRLRRSRHRRAPCARAGIAGWLAARAAALQLAAVLLAAGLAAWQPVQAAPDAPQRAGQGGRPLGDAEVRRWFARIHVAAQQLNYQGTLVFSADGVLSSAQVAHFHTAAGSFERLEVLDGRMQRIYRHNDQVATLWPARRVALIEQRDSRLASLRQVLDPRAREFYRVYDQGGALVAGREATVLRLDPADALRFARRLWVDARTALVLRTDVLDAADRVLESSAFSQVEIGVKPRPQSVLQPMRQLDGWRRVRPRQTAAHLAQEGWTLAPLAAGFELTGCARRSLDPAGADAAVLQLAFSDGITHVSLFIEPASGQRTRQPMQGHSGATHTLMQPHGADWWITAVGDVPAATLRQFVQALQRRD